MLFNRSAATRALGAAAVLLVPLGLLSSAPAGAELPVGGSTVRVTAGIGGAPLVGELDTEQAVVSSNGRFVAFTSEATNLVAGDTNGAADVFLTDRLHGTTALVSVTSDEEQGDGLSENPSISDDGRYIAFESQATDLVAGDSNGQPDVFLRDRVDGTTERISVDSDEVGTSEGSSDPDITGNGFHVAFATNGALDPADGNARQDIYVRNHLADITTLASRTSTGALSDGSSLRPAIDARGTLVAFESAATDMVPGDTNGETDIFVADLLADTVVRASVGPNGGQLDVDAREPDISGAADVVVYESERPDGSTGVRLRDLDDPGSVPLSPSETDAYAPSIDLTGTRVAYALDAGRTCNGNTPVLYDVDTGLSSTPFGAPATGLCFGGTPAISPDGRYLATTTSTVLTPGSPGDTAAENDVYLRVMADAVFPDVAPSNLFFEPVSWMADEEITTGSDDGTFAPTQVITRQSLAAFLYRYIGDEPRATPRATPTFTDVPEDHPFFEEIEWAVDRGFVEGFDDGTFRPTNPVSRQILAAFLFRLEDTNRAVTARSDTFTDVPDDHRFHDEIGWTAEQGIVQGYDDGTFRPTDPVSRQAAAAFLFRFEWTTFRGPIPV
jgi:Tol biopolymer transport system component